MVSCDERYHPVWGEGAERRVGAHKPRAVGVHSCGVYLVEACEVERGDESVEVCLQGRLVHTWRHNHLCTRLQTGTQYLCCCAQLCTCCRPGYVVYFLS